MLIYDNGNLNILSHTKCGHIAMINYLAVKELKQFEYSDWLVNPSPKILVIRHPVERMHSAISWADAMFLRRLKEYDETGKCDNFHLIANLVNSTNREAYIQDYIFNAHCKPYMHIIKKQQFRIIKFEELRNYIPKMTAFDTKTQNRALDPFPENTYFNRKDMLQEIEDYEEILQQKELITSEEWKELT